MKKKITLTTMQSFPLLDSLPANDLEWLQKRLNFQSATKNEVLITEGEMQSNLFFVLEGWLKVEKISADGRQQTIRYIGPGEVLNELAVFSQNTNPAMVIALEDAFLFSFARTTIDDLLGRNRDFSRAVIASLSSRIQYLLTLVEDLSLYSVEQRLARFLVDESKQSILFRQPWKTQTEIAARLGTVLDVVNRSLQKFASMGLIRLQRDKIIIVDKERLTEIATKQLQG